MIDPAIGAMLAGAFALLFVSAALNKLRSLQRFAEVFRAYRLLPGGVARLSWLVPALELTVGVGLLARRSRNGASAAGGGALGGSCGCGGPHERRPIAAWMVWRNLLLAGLLGAMLLPWIARPMAAADALTIGAGTAVAALLYMSLDRLRCQVTPRTPLVRGS